MMHHLRVFLRMDGADVLHGSPMLSLSFVVSSKVPVGSPPVSLYLGRIRPFGVMATPSTDSRWCPKKDKHRGGDISYAFEVIGR